MSKLYQSQFFLKNIGKLFSNKMTDEVYTKLYEVYTLMKEVDTETSVI